MEFIESFETSKNQFSKKINQSKFLEGRQSIEKKGVDDICEIIIGNNEIDYTSCDNKQKPSFIITKKLEIASQNSLFDPNEDLYIKKFNSSLIQAGLQHKNYLSSILYLNEYYKIKCIIYNQETNQYYQTTQKNYDPLYCIYKNNSWHVANDIDVDLSKLSDCMDDLKTILTLDIKDIYIYKPFLMPLSKYKVKELEDIAKKYSISLTNENGKKKLKKQLYDNINLKHYTQDI